MERIWYTLICYVLHFLQSHGAEPAKNVLFIATDDLRPQINALLDPDSPPFVHPKMVTPNLDRLASQSMVFSRAYVQEALCSPSRSSAMTSRRPDTTHVYNQRRYWRTVGGNFSSIPQYFKKRGYESIGIGKIYHYYADQLSWSWDYYAPPLSSYGRANQTWRAIPEDEIIGEPLPDMYVKNRTVETLRYLAENGTENPFFLAIGFYKPHLPFEFPEKYLQYYDPSEVELPSFPHAPIDMPFAGWNLNIEIGAFDDIAPLNISSDVNSTLPDSVILDLRRAYYAAVTYVDAMIGEVLDVFEELGFANNTIVSFWSDHGYHLGENGQWCKNTNFEVANRVPLMIRIPGVTDGGKVSRELVEMVDVFPTLVEAVGLPPMDLCPENSSNIEECTEGESLMPLIRGDETDWKQAVFYQFPREPDAMARPRVMGYSIRTHDYRYTEWAEFQGAPVYRPLWNQSEGVELYDHTVDPYENFNLANSPDYVDVQKELQERLYLGWRYE